jgi:hypothetical protein
MLTFVNAGLNIFNVGLKSFFTGLYERMVDGTHVYSITGRDDWGKNMSNLAMAQNHPILTPAMLFDSKIFSQATFEIYDKETKSVVKDHKLLSLLNNPNHYQTTIDLLETLRFMMIAQGQSVAYLKRVPGGLSYNSIYILNPDLIKWPDCYTTKMSSRALLDKSNGKIVYDENGENIQIYLKDLLFFYDSPNGLDKKNSYKNKSRLDGLKQTLINTHDSLLAKNIILKTNGKELITGKSGSFPLDPEEKERIENLYQANYGLSKTRKRAIITRADVSHKSLHIALRDLGLDESVKVDGNLIYTALHIPKDILSLEAKKTTYNNFKESMVSFIQNEMQGSMDAVTAVFQKLITEPNLVLRANYNHLPVMQFVLLEKYKMIKLRVDALASARKAGLPDEEALELCDFDRTIKLTELPKNEEPGTSEAGTSEEGESGD